MQRSVALLSLLLASCGSDAIDGPYRLETTDIPEDMMLCFDLGDGGCIQRVPQTVFAVGYDKKYVVAARHPHRFEDTRLDRGATEYFYIDRALDGPRVDPEKSVRGPFDQATFEQERRRLGLPVFTREIASLK